MIGYLLLGWRHRGTRTPFGPVEAVVGRDPESFAISGFDHRMNEWSRLVFELERHEIAPVKAAQASTAGEPEKTVAIASYVMNDARGESVGSCVCL